MKSRAVPTNCSLYPYQLLRALRPFIFASGRGLFVIGEHAREAPYAQIYRLGLDLIVVAFGALLGLHSRDARDARVMTLATVQDGAGVVNRLPITPVTDWTLQCAIYGIQELVLLAQSLLLCLGQRSLLLLPLAKGDRVSLLLLPA